MRDSGESKIEATQRQIDSITIDINRLGSQAGLISEGQRYIALAGRHAPPSELKMPLEHRDFMRNLNSLRYLDGVNQEQRQAALTALAESATYFLPAVGERNSERPLQIDLVMGTAELWAFPFEACYSNGAWPLADRSRDIILTRRIRREFASVKRPWPVSPRVLFAHAPATEKDLPQDLIERHTRALESALKPWSPKDDPQGEGLLKVQRVLDADDLQTVVQAARGNEPKGPFTHVHVLAHGKKIEVDRLEGSYRWGLRLGKIGEDASDPEELARILRPRDGMPVVVTVAACDSANQAEPTIPERSFAQELHERGVPIVIASQLPLTHDGSVTLTKTFYQKALEGDDVRWALHEARIALYDEQKEDHDWVSVVGYVDLPEGYSSHLLEVNVKRDLELLKAARSRLDRVLAAPGKPGLGVVENLVRARIASLSGRLPLIPSEKKELRDECQGILASAHKRLAELLFRRAERASGEARKQYGQSSKESLRASLANYSTAFQLHIHNHWLGTQLVALEAVLNGKLEDPQVWSTTLHGARLAIANNQEEFWAWGTIVELWLLAPILGEPRELRKAKEALDFLVQRSNESDRPDAEYAVPSTRDQLARYTDWWMSEYGYFGDKKDLASDARELVDYLDSAAKNGTSD